MQFLLSNARCLPLYPMRTVAWCLRFSSSAATVEQTILRTRNVGISAHIDSGKTTLTERILYYTKRITEINEVKGKSGKGATMDFMDLEREKGITIQSAATHCTWGDNTINIIDTPGHVDFTIEVERALRVLDGAIMVLCGVSGVQSQTLTVDKQMKRYNVPRISFVNKCDRMGANPLKIVQQIKDKLRVNAAAIQLPIGLEDKHEGVIDLVTMEAVYFDKSDLGAKPIRKPIPKEMMADATSRRSMLIDAVCDSDDALTEMVLNDKTPTVDEVKAAIRRATLSLKFTPVFMGSAYKNKGVQPLLDGVVDYLPNPTEVKNVALDASNNEAPVELVCDPAKPFVGLAFKLEERPYGTLTYLRIYQGTLRKSDYLYNQQHNMERAKVPRLVRMHANMMEEISEIGPGQICATFGMECASGDTFTASRDLRLTMTSMHVPEPVMSLAVQPKDRNQAGQFSKGVQRFTREDPTLRVEFDPETKETIMKGMGELHLEIYLERLNREYGVICQAGQPRVAYTETITRRAEFNYLHKKQSGGSGQYARVMGYIEPLPEGGDVFQFVDRTIGNNIPPGFKAAIEKGFKEALEKGPLTGHPVLGIRVTLTDGQAHVVDSNELSFKTAAIGGFRQGFLKADPEVREPIMKVEIDVPMEFQGSVIGGVSQRRGMIVDTTSHIDTVTILAHVPLANMFGYSTALRSSTQGKGEFTMEYMAHQPVMRDVQKTMEESYRKTRFEQEEE